MQLFIAVHLQQSKHLTRSERSNRYTVMDCLLSDILSGLRSSRFNCAGAISVTLLTPNFNESFRTNQFDL